MQKYLKGLMPMFFGMMVMTSSAQCPFSVDGDAVRDVTRDGLLLVRYAQGLRGGALVAGTNASADVVEAAITSNKSKLDVNGSGEFDVYDAMIIARVLGGYQAAPYVWLPDGYAGPGAKRRTTDHIKAYIDSGCATPLPVLEEVKLTSSDATIAADTVVTFGQVFPEGEIASGKFVYATQNGTQLATQTDVKRRHPDGSVRHAIVSVKLPAISATSGSAQTSLMLWPATNNVAGGALALSAVNSASSPVDYRVEIDDQSLKTTADYQAGDPTKPAAEAGKTWSVNLTTALADNATPWLSGSLLSEWRSRVAPRNGSNQHPGLRVLFDARYQSASAGRVSIALENVESSAARGDRIYTIRIFKIENGASTQIYSNTNFTHRANTRYRNVYYFGAGSKEITAAVDTDRMKDARSIPNYATAAVPEGSMASIYSNLLASPRGIYENGLLYYIGMGNTSGRPDIGPIPGWSALALVSRDARMYRVMFDYAERSGFWPIHWRDSLRLGATAANADMFSTDVHPNFSLNSLNGTGQYIGNPDANWQGDSLSPPDLPMPIRLGWEPDHSHQPSLSYAPYLVTGDPYYLDAMMYWGTWNLIKQNFGYREGAKSLLWPIGDVRGQAWSMRTLGHMSWIAPDGDWRGSYAMNKLNNNLTWYRQHVLNQSVLGFWHYDDASIDEPFDPFNEGGSRSPNIPDSSMEVRKMFAPWQHDFMAYMFTQLCDWGIDAKDLRDYTLAFTVRRFTSGADYDRRGGSVYRLPTVLADGSVISTMAQMSQHAFSNKPYETRTKVNLPVERMDTAGQENGYGAIAAAALSAAVDTGALSRARASEAYRYVRSEHLLMGYSSILNNVVSPTWNIVPRTAVDGLNVVPGIYLP